MTLELYRRKVNDPDPWDTEEGATRYYIYTRATEIEEAISELEKAAQGIVDMWYVLDGEQLDDLEAALATFKARSR